MRFSAKGEYAVRAVIDIALFGDTAPVQVKEISRRQEIPERFLEQIMSSLKKSGLVESVRGAQGGYYLLKDQSNISLIDIIEAIEGPLEIMKCTSGENIRCKEVELCALREVWSDVKETIVDALNAVSLKDICERTKSKLKVSTQ